MTRENEENLRNRVAKIDGVLSKLDFVLAKLNLSYPYLRSYNCLAKYLDNPDQDKETLLSAKEALEILERQKLKQALRTMSVGGVWKSESEDEKEEELKGEYRLIMKLIFDIDQKLLVL